MDLLAAYCLEMSISVPGKWHSRKLGRPKPKGPTGMHKIAFVKPPFSLPAASCSPAFGFAF